MRLTSLTLSLACCGLVAVAQGNELEERKGTTVASAAPRVVEPRTSAPPVAPEPEPAAPVAEAPVPAVPMLESVVYGASLQRTSGSAQVVGKRELEKLEYDDPQAALGGVTGVYSRGEDGVGLRPNIGLRGTNPDRSKKVTLLEDGVPFAPAPYSAPAAYYFPTITRMSQIRVLKGPAGLVYGPQTIGGAIDLVTRPIPEKPTAGVDVAGGEYLYGKAHAYAGASTESFGALVEGLHLRSDGFKELPDRSNTGFARNEWMAKGFFVPAAGHELRLKLTYSDEWSNETYLGLTDADFRENPDRRYGASLRDRMENHRTSAVLTHELELADDLRITTSLDRSAFARTWFKVNAFRDASLFDVLVDPESPRHAVYYDVLRGGDSTSAGEALLVGPNERDYVVHGLQTRVHWDPVTGPVEHRVEAGLRLHHDGIERRHTQDAFAQVGGALSSDGTATELTAWNTAETYALATHLLDTATIGKLTLTGGLRLETMRSSFTQLADRSTESRWATALLPSLGAFYGFNDTFGVLAGAYRGFSPPAPGSGPEIEPERSVNYEAGARLSWQRLSAELIGFYNDYSNLTDVCTLSSGCVDENLDRQFDAGKARIYGVEASARHDLRLGKLRFPMSVAYTLTQAQFLNDFDSDDPIYGRVRAGDGLPYVPQHQLNASVGVEHRRASLTVAANYVGRMREQAGSAPLGESLATDAQFTVDASGSVKLNRTLSLYLNVRNLLDERFIVSRRPFGARPNAPRWIQLGLKAGF